MKACLGVLAGIALLMVSGCGGAGVSGANAGLTPTPTPTPTPTQASAANTWTWMAGSNLINQPGTYGTQGVASSQNTPGNRMNSVNWIDNSGNLWLFGGMATPSATQDNFLNDLWEFNGSQWIWQGGSSGFNQAGIYGTLGVAAPGNIPGARFQAVSWKDASGDVWLFGGLGIDANGRSEFLNDLWKFSGGQWTWMGGSNIGIQNLPGIYGTKGVAAPTNQPGERSLATAWTDTAGNFWMFGGSGWDSAGALGDMNDLWEFSGGQWTWISGSNLINQLGVYGVKGTAAPGNTPGARFSSSSWVDAAGDFWIFGGQTGTSSFLPINDLWKFSGGQWTWISGADVPDQPDVFGTLGVPAADNTPGARTEANSWIDAAGSLWLFGSSDNDLWRFNAGEWTWMGGPNPPSPRGVYGTLGAPASSNIPSARFGAVNWKDASGNIWLFGGLGEDTTGTSGELNDLWRLQP